MSKYYVFFTRNVLPQPEAHIVHDVNTANAAANLGYPAVLIYLQTGRAALNPLPWFLPFRPHSPLEELVQFYNLQARLKVIPLAMPWPISEKAGKWLHPSTWVCRYYFPVHIFRHTQLLHTLDWNLVKTAIRAGIPVIYEREHNQSNPYDPAIVNHPLFQVAVTVADSVRDNMIARGMPPEKIVKLPLSFNQAFLVRQPEQATQWRKQLLKEGRQKLVVYSGGLYKFKGVNLLLEVAQVLPEIQFVLAGGNASQVNAYEQLVQEKHLENVTFLGYIQHDRLPSLLQAADLLAHPHCSGAAATFTSPLKFFEYLASGVPIVATEIPPLREFKAAQIVAGWCEPDNPAQFTQCLQHTLQRYPRKAGGYEAQIEFARQFSWESRIVKIMSYVQPSLRPTLLS
jgi:glycosyltransferase involved in cell wall biosynthesis